MAPPEPSADLNAVLRSEPERLDLVMAHIARLDPSAWPPDQVASAFGELAAGVADPSAVTVLAHVFATRGFRGAGRRYYDPANSLIHRVLERQRGIPLSLAVVAAEVSRRVGGTLSVVGFPGHVLIGDGGTESRIPERWYDPFAAAAPLGTDDLQRILSRTHPGQVLRTEMLASMSAVDITVRTLNNLVNAYQQLGDLGRVADVMRLRVGLDVATIADRRGLAGLLGGLGRHDAAAVEFERLQVFDPDRAAEYQALVDRLVAHRN